VREVYFRSGFLRKIKFGFPVGSILLFSNYQSLSEVYEVMVMENTYRFLSTFRALLERQINLIIEETWSFWNYLFKKATDSCTFMQKPVA